jgi:hypothetical protein
MNSLSNFLIKIANWKTFLVFFGLYIVFNAYFFPKGFKSDVPISDQNLPILDLQMTYNPDRVKSIITQYTGAAKKAAIKGHLITDTIYPIVYFFLFGIALSSVFYKWKINPWFKWINIVPLIIILFDYLENYLIIKMFNYYPLDMGLMPHFCSLFTVLKWVFVGITSVILLIGIVLNLLKK